MKPRYTLKYKRRREGKTNYKKRLGMLKSGKLRLIIRKSLTNMYVQIIKFDPKGDKIIACGSGFDLKKEGWKHSAENIPAAYLVGLLTGKKIMQKGIKEAVLDLGMQNNIAGGRIYAALKGLIDAGLNIPHSPEILPNEDRICGKHISDYKKNNMTKEFNDIKKKIIGG